MERRNNNKVFKPKNILVILFVCIIILCIFFIVEGSKDKKNNDDNNEEKYYIDLAENYRQNTSSKLSESRKIGNLDVIGAGISYLNGRSTFSLNLKNNSDDISNEMKVRIYLLNKNEQTVKILVAYISELDVDEETQINIVDESDITNVYDYKVEVE